MVTREMDKYVLNGGFMFAMCAATDTYDIARAAAGVDICGSMFDGDPADPDAQEKLDFSHLLHFIILSSRWIPISTNFQILMRPTPGNCT